MIYETTHLAGVFNVTQSTSGTENPADWFVKAIGGGGSDAGLTVDASTMLTSGPIWEAINIIADDVAMLPMNVFKRIGEDDKEKVRNHNAYRLLQREPHRETTPFDFRARLTADALTWGNGVAFINRNMTTADSMTLMDPAATSLKRDEDTNELMYTTIIDGVEYFSRQKDTFHIKGFGNGLWGYSVFDNARHEWGLNLALVKHGNKTFANGAKPSGVLMSPHKMKSEGREGLRREWNEVHQGLDNSGNIAILTGGIDYKAITVPNREAEWVAGLELSDKRVASWFKLPPHKLGYLKDSAVRANLEEQNREYLQQCLAPWLKRWEHEAERKLLSRTQFLNDTHFVRFNTGALLKGDFRSTMEAIQIGRQAEVLSINDGRRIIDENSIGPKGDEYINPATRSDSGSGNDERSGGEDGDDQDTNDAKKGGASNTHSGNEVAAVVQLAAESLQKIQTLERRELVKAAKHKADTFEQAADKFYDRSREFVCDAISTIVRLGQTLAITPPDVSADALAQTWITESYDRITVAVGGADDAVSAVEAELKTWPTRQDAFVATLLGKGRYETASTTESV